MVLISAWIEVWCGGARTFAGKLGCEAVGVLVENAARLDCIRFTHTIADERVHQTLLLDHQEDVGVSDVFSIVPRVTLGHVIGHREVHL